MAIARKIERELLRNEYLQTIMDYIVVTVKVPTGANKGLEPYDGFEMAKDYEMKLEEKAEKAKRKEKEKAKKIAKDKEIREKKENAK